MCREHVALLAQWIVHVVDLQCCTLYTHVHVDVCATYGWWPNLSLLVLQTTHVHTDKVNGDVISVLEIKCSALALSADEIRPVRARAEDAVHAVQWCSHSMQLQCMCMSTTHDLLRPPYRTLQRYSARVWGVFVRCADWCLIKHQSARLTRLLTTLHLLLVVVVYVTSTLHCRQSLALGQGQVWKWATSEATSHVYLWYTCCSRW